jgi:hypothetical protein
MWVTIGGKAPLFRSGSAMLCPPRIEPIASPTTSCNRAFSSTWRPISMACRSWTPLASRVESVREKRATATSSVRRPKIGMLSLNVSQRSFPLGVRFQRRNPTTALTISPSSNHQ